MTSVGSTLRFHVLICSVCVGTLCAAASEQFSFFYGGEIMTLTADGPSALLLFLRFYPRVPSKVGFEYFVIVVLMGNSFRGTPDVLLLMRGV